MLFSKWPASGSSQELAEATQRVFARRSANPVRTLGGKPKPQPRLGSRAGPVPWPRGAAEPSPGLALQLHFLEVSESMGNHDSKIVDAGSID
jgi:hypothetical protein